MTDQLERPKSAFPALRRTPLMPPAVYGELREAGPVQLVTFTGGLPIWAITRYADVRAALADPRLNSDPPEHSAARGAVVDEFTARRMRALRPRIQRIVDDRLDAMVAGPRPADLVEALALPVPSLVIGELLGVPSAGHDFFQARSSTLVRRSHSPEQRITAYIELRDYMLDLIEAKESAGKPGDDLIGRQIARQRAESGAVDRNALAELAYILLAAGHETTANMISLGTVALVEHPDQLATIVEDPGRTPAAVEELLRFFTITDTAMVRLAVEDLEIAGVTIHAGEGVLLVGNSANHDPREFENPDALDVCRQARGHIGFGYGVHQCLGRNLARLVLQVVFDTLFARVPTLALAAPLEELRFKGDGVLYGLYDLPVTW